MQNASLAFNVAITAPEKRVAFKGGQSVTIATIRTTLMLGTRTVGTLTSGVYLNRDENGSGVKANIGKPAAKTFRFADKLDETEWLDKVTAAVNGWPEYKQNYRDAYKVMVAAKDVKPNAKAATLEQIDLSEDTETEQTETGTTES